jgi:hypothetical protein
MVRAQLFSSIAEGFNFSGIWELRENRGEQLVNDHPSGNAKE